MEFLHHLIEYTAQNWYTVILSFIVVMAVLNFATSKLEGELVVIGKKLKLPDGVRGGTFDAISSSLPELLTVFVGLMSFGAAGLEIGIGTVSGSAIFNILIIPFFSILAYKGVKKISPEKSGVNRDTIFYLFSIIVFLLGLYFGDLLIMSICLIGVYFGYLFVLFLDTEKNKKLSKKLVNEAFEEVKNTKISYWTIFYSLVLIYLGVEVAVACASFVGENLGISAMVVSLVILAAVTSIPDTLLSVKSAKKGMINASLSNAVGSNIFDICIGLGVPIFIGVAFLGLNPKVDFAQNAPIFVFLVASVIFYYGILQKKNIKKIDSLWFLMFYLGFLGYLVRISV
ncbi:hypothetical protein LR002_00640 [Candidatus Gracilibacteria bacterium]|nr:hypothetical protein [Candidatus Gracilibacteria bacterium]